MASFDYPRISLELSSPDTQELITIDKEVRECESIRNELVSELAKIDSSIQEYKDELYEISKDSFDYAETALGRINERRFDSGKLNAWDKANLVAAGASAAIGIAAGTVGLVSGKIKEHKAKKAFEKKMDELLENKVIIAGEKLPYVTEIFGKMQSGVFARIETLFSSMFETSVTNDNNMMDKQILMFRKSLGMVIKTRELADSFKYIISEMQAWQNGKHDSDYSRNDMTSLFCQEINSWPGKYKAKDWEELSRKAYLSTEKSLSLPLAFTFSDPVMLCQYVRIGLPEEGSMSCLETEGEEKGFIIEGEFTNQTEQNGQIHKIGTIKVKDTLAGSIIKKNSYYQNCENIAEDSFVFPTEPVLDIHKFGIADAIVVLLALAIIAGYVCAIFAIFKGTFFRTLFILLPYLIGVCVDFCGIDDFGDVIDTLIDPIEDFFDWFVDILPYSRHNDKEYRKITNYKSNISSIESSILKSKRSFIESKMIKL